MTVPVSYCGFVAIVGRPNVGKSTLLNRLIKQKISITARKPQTTRQQILGIDTQDNYQVIYVDTPGMHWGEKRKLNRYMNQIVTDALVDVDIILFVVQALQLRDDDERLLNLLKKAKKPVFAVINQVDRVKNKDDLLPFMTLLNDKFDFAAMLPLSAKKDTSFSQLQQVLQNYLPASEFLYPSDQITDRNDRFLAREIIREKIIRFTGQELPYASLVELEKFSLEKNIYHIVALIWVERPGQKKILIGHKGEKLKQVASQARLDLEKLLGKKVYLQLWVKVKAGWPDDPNRLVNA